MESPPPILVYQALMQGAKERIACLRRLSAGTLSTDDDLLNWELAALQLRKLLESIAFASLSAHKDAYAKVHANFQRHWKAASILRELSAIHPNFYPQPVSVGAANQRGVRRLSKETGYLTQEEFVELYDLCSQVIHTNNPFGSSKPIDFRLTLDQWVTRIQKLLDTHAIEMHGLSQLWVVQMAGAADGGVLIAVADPHQ